MQKKPVNVFQIPPAASAQGHCSADWRGKQIWTGSCQIMHELNTCCKIQLVNEDQSVFAASTITDGSTYDTHITRAYDSSRAFALVLVSDSGQRATVGLMFPERNDSFDFINALDNFKKAYRVEKGLDSNFQKPDAEKIAADLCLKEGEKITINFANMQNQNKLAQQATTTAAPKKIGGGLKKLAPPPGFKGKPKQGNGGDLLGGNSGPSNDLLGLGSEPVLANNNTGGLDALLGSGTMQNLAAAPNHDAFAELDFSSGQSNLALEQATLPQAQPAAPGGDFDAIFGSSSATTAQQAPS